MSTSPQPWPAVQTTNIETAPGVTLDDHQKTLVGSVLDVSSRYNISKSQLFQGKATKDKLALWKDDAVFEDPICIAYPVSESTLIAAKDGNNTKHNGMD
jgi:hypothetical protein